MTTAAEYREFAKECTEWAADAESEEMCEAFLAMARQWMEAALLIDGLGGSLDITQSDRTQHTAQH